MTPYERQRLDAAIRAVAPIHGTSGSPPDVRIDFTQAATPQQQTNALAVLAAFDDSQAAQDAWDAEQTARRIGVTRAVRKTADQAFSSNQFADVDDLSILLAPNSHYEFHCYGAYTAAAATTGIQISVSGPANPNVVRFVGWIAETATTTRNGAGGAYEAAIAGAASAAATAMPFELLGSIGTGATGGLFRLRVRSEVNGSAVNVLRGSIMKVSAVA